MLDDILAFASDTLVDNGRLSFWMPTANDEEQEIPVPAHPCLEVVVVCVQVFNKCTSESFHPFFLVVIVLTFFARVKKINHLPEITGFSSLKVCSGSA